MNLLASNSNLLSMEVTDISDASMVKDVFDSKEVLQEKLKVLAMRKKALD